MFRDLPKKKICMVLVRHAESKRNAKKARQILANNRFELRTHKDYNSGLSPMGVVEGYLAGKYIRNRVKGLIGYDGFDFLATSPSKRAVDTGGLIRAGWNQMPKFSIQRPELGEMRHWLETKLAPYMVYMREKADQAFDSLDADVVSRMSRDEIETAVATYLMTELYVDMSGSIILRAVKDKFADPRTWKKLDEGEDFFETRKRLEPISDVINPYIDFGVRVIVCATHARTITAGWDLLEDDLPRGFIQKALLSEGPPYPSNIGMTFYVSENGKFKRASERNEVPPEFKAETGKRLLDFSEDVTGEQLQKVCNLLGLKCKVKPSNLKKPVPRRTVSGTMRAVSSTNKPVKARARLVKPRKKKS